MEALVARLTPVLSTLVVCALLAAAPAVAQPAPAGVDAVTPEDRAFLYYQESREFFEQGDFKGARARLEKAWELFNHPAIGLKLADVLEKLDDPEGALAALDAIRTDDPEFAQQVEVRSKALRSYLNQPLKVSVVSNAAQTSVVIDHKERRVAPFEVTLPRGIHVFEALADGYRGAKKVVTVQGSKPLLIRFDLQPLTGTLAVRGGDDGLDEIRISVDGVPWELSDDERDEHVTRARTVGVGTHQFVCWRDGYTKDVRRVNVREGEDVLIDCLSQPIASGSSARAWAYASGGAGLAALGGGAFLIASYMQDLDKGERERLDVDSNKHIFGGVLLGAGVGLGVTSWLLFRRAARLDRNLRQVAAPAPRWWVAPSFDGAGLQGGLRF